MSADQIAQALAALDRARAKLDTATAEREQATVRLAEALNTAGRAGRSSAPPTTGPAMNTAAGAPSS